jgi:hypothetical protein
MLWQKALWHVLVVIGGEALPYHYFWLTAWLRNKQPILSALALPLLHGELFLVAAVIWLLSTARLLAFALYMPERLRMFARIHWLTLVCCSGAVFAPLIVFVAKDDGMPLGGLGLRVELMTICLAVIHSIWVRLFTLIYATRCDVLVLLRSPRSKHRRGWRLRIW